MISNNMINVIRRSSFMLMPTLLLALGASGTLYAADLFKGGKLYAAHCVACHGVSGVSMMPGTPNFVRNGTLLQPDMMLFNSIKSGKNVMPSFQGILKDQDIMDVIAYLRTMN